MVDKQETSAGGSMGIVLAPLLLVLPFGSMSETGTASPGRSLEELGRRQVTWSQTSSLDSKARRHSTQASSEAISELRRLSGLTWTQLAKVFGVSRRSLHFWASGEKLNAPNEERLRRILALVRRADRGTARTNREILLQDRQGIVPLDLLAEGKLDEFIKLVGPGSRRSHLRLNPISSGAREARKPLSPAEQFEVCDDHDHREIGRGRVARTARNMRRKRG